MTGKLFIVTTFLAAVFSCTIPKEARLVKKTAKTWSESAIVLSAYSDTPFSGIFLKLRENGKFEYSSSGLFSSYEAGNWTNVSDTINLSYLDSKNNVTGKQKILIDSTTATLLFKRDDTPVQMRLRIMTNEL